MRVLRTAAVLVLLGLTLGAPWASAAQARSDIPQRELKRATPSALHLLDPWQSLITILLMKAGCRIDPLGHCAPGGTQTQDTDAGCTIDPLGRCTPGH